MLNRDIGNVAGASVAQIGAGGAGAATALALAKQKVGRLALYDPDAGKADALVARLVDHFPEVEFAVCRNSKHAIAGADGIVNATPVGMVALPGVPFDPALMSAHQWLADIIYFPLETELLAAARRNGQTVTNGISMVIGQAAEAFRLVTGVEPDKNRMLTRLLDVIAAERAQEKAA
jgi:shikimate dehydrogenase